ncbi:MAG: NosD domain-containing protein [Candidatus Hodarchaeota archaeon]
MNLKKKQLTLGLLIVISMTFPFYSALLLNSASNQTTKKTFIHDIKSSQYVLTSPIIINQSEPTQTWAYTELNYVWCSGSGTWADPYLIQDVTIDLNDGAGSCITVADSTGIYFRIMDCTLINSGWEIYNSAGIRLENTNNGFLINNTCSSHEYVGIYLYESDNNTISGNLAGYNQQGISLLNSHNNTIINNAIFQNNIGIHNAISHNNTINGNIANNNGISISGSENCTLSSNIFTSGGIAVSGELDELITLNIDISNLANAKAIYYYKNKEMLMNSDFINPGQILLVNCSDSIFTNFDITYTGTGLYLGYCDNITISNGDFNYNDVGISIVTSSFINISDNYAENNDVTGISVYNSENCTCSGNNANDNYDPDGWGYGYGIAFSSCENCTILGNTANNNFYSGLDILYCNEMIISGNTFSNQYYGINGYNIDNSKIDGNIINGRVTLDLWCIGIYFAYESFNNTLTNNQMTNCGIKLYEYDDLIYLKSHDIDDTNLANGKPIYYYVDQDGLIAADFNNAGQILLINTNNSVMDNLQISNTSVGIWVLKSNGNTISNSDLKHNKEEAIFMLNSNDNIITGNTINDNGETALILRECTNNNITDNSITDDPVNNPRTGISIQECNNFNILRNDISGCYNGLEIFGDYNTVSFNNISNNQDNGIWLSDAIYNTFSNNIINNNSWNGLYLEVSDNNDILNNTISYNKAYGLYLSTSDSNTVEGNTFYCNRDGCWQDDGSGNTFYNNSCEDCPEDENGGPEFPGIPGYNLILIIGLISVFTAILMKRRKKF